MAIIMIESYTFTGAVWRSDCSGGRFNGAQ
jgi:hypothetical protein